MRAENLWDAMERTKNDKYSDMHKTLGMISDLSYNFHLIRKQRAFIDTHAMDGVIEMLRWIREEIVYSFLESGELSQLSCGIGNEGKSIYMTRKYRKLRENVILAYGRVCMKCKSTSNIELDHIKPVSKYPELFLDTENMQILCSSCNSSKSNLNEIDYRGVEYVRVDKDTQKQVMLGMVY